MANITLLPSAKVPLIYDGELTMTTEWYRFFWNIYGFTGTGIVPVNKGGTGLDTIGEHQIIIGNANNVFEPALMRGFGINVTYDPGYVNISIGASGVIPGTYGNAATVGQFTINEYGVITFADNIPIAIAASQITSGTLAVVRGGTGQSTYVNGELLIGNSTGNTLTKATLTAGTGISVTNGAGSITIANTGVLSVSGTAPVVSSGGATPAISMAAANTTTNGYLTSADWNTFNNKAPATSGTSILYGNGSGGFSNVTIGSGVSFVGGTLSATGAGGTITAVTGVAPIASSGGTTPAISISQATTSTNGYLSSTDWNTFNNKQPAGTYVTSVTGTAPVVSSGGTTPAISMAAASASTNGYLTSTDWSTFNAKQPAGSYLTAVSVVSANGFAGTSSGGLTPALTLSTTITGLLKGNGTAISAATSGTDYAPATSGTSILYGNGAGGFSNVTIGTGLTFVGGTLASTASGGTVTSVAALTLGTTGTDLSSTVANPTTTPVITLNVPTASAANRGALSAADWTTFNSKAPGVTFTTGYIPYGQGTTTLNQSSALTFSGTALATTGTFTSSGTTALTWNGGSATTAQVVIGTTGSASSLFINTPSVNSSYASGLGIDGTYGTPTGRSVINLHALGTKSGGPYASDMAFYTSTGTAESEKMRIFSSGGVSIGNTTDPGANNLSVTGTVKGSTHYTNAGQTASTASGSAVTLFSITGDNVYIVSAAVTGTSAPASYTAVALVKSSGSTLAIINLSTATNLTITVSGTNIQATQTSGVAQIIVYSAIKLFS